MKQMEFTKENGVVADADSIHSWLDRQLRWLRNGRHTISLSAKIRSRTIAQNRLMWLWFNCISDETGQPINDIHDYYCAKFLKREVISPATAEVTIVAGHTSTLSTDQFSRFLNEVQADAQAELGIALPDPEDMTWQEFEERYR